MARSPFPEDPNAERCVVTGTPAHARNEGGLIRGWYGSTVVDGDLLVAVEPGFPEGALCDEVLRQAIAEGRVYDPAALQAGQVPLRDAPDEAIVALVAAGAAHALACLERKECGRDLHVPPIRDLEGDDPLISEAAAALFGRPRDPGPNLYGIGSLVALAARARGRADLDPLVLAGEVLDRIRSQEAVANDIYSSLEP